ncbi:tRNA (adenosine(37)-N6)-threonylcarbamoyltransferase complex dimerization subunit type 1 TsaB [Maricaulis sp. CAU 1757]
MNLLAIDTTGADCSVALRRPGLPDRAVCETIGRGHAERLAPMVRDLLVDAGLAPRDIDRIGITIGPGSFAGTRVGVAFARGLAIAVEAEVVGISNLAVWAAMQDGHGPILAAHDARRGDIVLQLWNDTPDGPPQRLDLDGARQLIAELDAADLRIVGSGAGLLNEFGETVEISGLDASCLLDLVAAADPQAAPPTPFYARPPDAKLPGGVEPAS